MPYATLFNLSGRFCRQSEPFFGDSAQKHDGPELARNLNARLSAAWMHVESISINPPPKDVADVGKRIQILNDCVIPRLERVTNGFNRDLMQLSASHAKAAYLIDEGGRRVTGIEFMNHHAKAAYLIDERGRQITGIELMIKFLNSRIGSGTFWASLVRWQMCTYQETCIRLVEDYKKTTRHVTGDRSDVETILAALSAAVRRACEQPEPSPEKTTFVDAFAIRNLYDDPGLKALVESNMFTPQQRRELYEAAEELIYQQPAFPPECYALLSNTNDILQH